MESSNNSYHSCCNYSSVGVPNEKFSLSIAFLFCFFIYPVFFKFSTVLTYLYIYGIPSLYLLVNYRLIRKLTRKQYVIISLACVLVCFSFLYPIFHGTGDFSYVKVATFIFRKMLIFAFLVCVMIKKYKDRVCWEHFIFYYSFTHAIYVIGTLVFVFVPDLKNVWFSVFQELVSTEQLESFGYLFRVGWQGFSGYRFTLHCTLSCVFFLYLLFACNSRFRINRRLLIVAYFLCLLGNMFYGRSGLLMTMVTSFIAIIVWNRKKIKKLISALITILLLLILLSFLKDVALLSDWYSWMSTPFINFITTGSFDNYSLSQTEEMVFMPSWKTVFLGDGYFMYNGSYYMQTDSGIVRNFLFWGILGAFFSYSMTLYSIMDLKKKSTLLCLLILCVFIVFEYKGDVYYEFVSLLLAASFVDSMSNKLYKIESKATNLIKKGTV